MESEIVENRNVEKHSKNTEDGAEQKCDVIIGAKSVLDDAIENSLKMEVKKM